MTTLAVIFVLVVTADLGFAFLVKGTSCQGRCNHHLQTSMTCQCNYACARYGDCCQDYAAICKHSGGTHTTVQPHHTTAQPHHTNTGGIADTLWQVDPDKVPITDITLNTGGHTSSGRRTDVSQNKLFTHVNTALLNKPIYQAMMALWDNYTPTRGVSDPVTSADKTEINHFLDLAMASPVMDETYKYLTGKGIFVGTKASFRQKVYSLWFEPYSRSGGSHRDSSGFEHVFVGEYKSSIVEGFHNWVRFYKEEQAGHINYLGYMKQVGPRLLEFTFDWNNHHKSIDSFVIGSSPVFDMALDTICILTRPNSVCPFTLNGHHFSIKQYDEAHTSGLQIATAYTVF